MKALHPGINDLATANPKLAAQWHPTRNGSLTAEQVTKRSNKKVWWLCPTCGHEWEARINNRNQGSGCPRCARQKVLTERKSLAAANPQLAAQWHPTRNGELTPADVCSGSRKNVWWLGECGHMWKATINQRTRGSGCAMCVRKEQAEMKNRTQIAAGESLAAKRPEIASQWHPTKNGDLTPEQVTKGSQKKVWWLCPTCGHEWEANVNSRNQGSGCPRCARQKMSAARKDTVSPIHISSSKVS